MTCREMDGDTWTPARRTPTRQAHTNRIPPETFSAGRKSVGKLGIQYELTVTNDWQSFVSDSVDTAETPASADKR
jgi:hypothetical protein